MAVELSRADDHSCQRADSNNKKEQRRHPARTVKQTADSALFCREYSRSHQKKTRRHDISQLHSQERNIFSGDGNQELPENFAEPRQKAQKCPDKKDPTSELYSEHDRGDPEKQYRDSIHDRKLQCELRIIFLCCLHITVTFSIRSSSSADIIYEILFYKIMVIQEAASYSCQIQSHTSSSFIYSISEPNPSRRHEISAHYSSYNAEYFLSR